MDGKQALPGFEMRELADKERRLRYYVGGSGPPLALVHGLGERPATGA